MDLEHSISYEELKDLYNRYFSLNNLGADINNKFALISLLCYVYNKMRTKNPNVTPYQIIMKIDANTPRNFAMGLSIMCEDFSYMCSEFPLFGLKGNQITAKIKELLSNILPF
jgi:hypothetical protein